MTDWRRRRGALIGVALVAVALVGTDTPAAAGFVVDETIVWFGFPSPPPGNTPLESCGVRFSPGAIRNLRRLDGSPNRDPDRCATDPEACVPAGCSISRGTDPLPTGSAGYCWVLADGRGGCTAVSQGGHQSTPYFTRRAASCRTRDPATLDAIRSMGPMSAVRFDVGQDGTCVDLSVEVGSRRPRLDFIRHEPEHELRIEPGGRARGGLGATRNKPVPPRGELNCFTSSFPINRPAARCDATDADGQQFSCSFVGLEGAREQFNALDDSTYLILSRLGESCRLSIVKGSPFERPMP